MEDAGAHVWQHGHSGNLWKGRLIDTAFVVHYASRESFLTMAAQNFFRIRDEKLVLIGSSPRCKQLGFIVVQLEEGTTSRPTLFMSAIPTVTEIPHHLLVE